MLIGQFFEASIYILNKQNCYHVLASFPKDAVKDDVHQIIKLS